MKCFQHKDCNDYKKLLKPLIMIQLQLTKLVKLCRDYLLNCKLKHNLSIIGHLSNNSLKDSTVEVEERKKIQSYLDRYHELSFQLL